MVHMYYKSNTTDIKDFLVNCDQHGRQMINLPEAIDYLNDNPTIPPRLIGLGYGRIITGSMLVTGFVPNNFRGTGAYLLFTHVKHPLLDITHLLNSEKINGAFSLTPETFAELYNERNDRDIIAVKFDDVSNERENFDSLDDFSKHPLTKPLLNGSATAEIKIWELGGDEDREIAFPGYVSRDSAYFIGIDLLKMNIICDGDIDSKSVILAKDIPQNEVPVIHGDPRPKLPFPRVNRTVQDILNHELFEKPNTFGNVAKAIFESQQAEKSTIEKLVDELKTDVNDEKKLREAFEAMKRGESFEYGGTIYMVIPGRGK